MFLSLLRNIAAGIAGLGGAIFWTKTVTSMSQSGRIPSRSARKLSHITTAPFFMLTWPLYSPHRYASLIAAAVPLTIALRVALSPDRDPLAVATARPSTTSHAEAIREDRSLAAYGISVAALTAIGWRSSAPVFIAASALCFGDGAADVVGTALRGPPLPLPSSVFSKRKTVPGTVSFVLATTAGARGLLRLANVAGLLTDTTPWTILLKVAMGSAIVELFPLEDNFTVPLTAMLLSSFLIAPK